MTINMLYLYQNIFFFIIYIFNWIINEDYKVLIENNNEDIIYFIGNAESDECYPNFFYFTPTNYIIVYFYIN